MKKLIIYWFDERETVEIETPTLEKIGVCRFLEEKGELVYFIEESTGDELHSLDEIEKRAILDALRKTNWNQTNAAKILGISQRVMNYKVDKYGIKNERWKKNK